MAQRVCARARFSLFSYEIIYVMHFAVQRELRILYDKTMGNEWIGTQIMRTICANRIRMTYEYGFDLFFFSSFNGDGEGKIVAIFAGMGEHSND